MVDLYFGPRRRPARTTNHGNPRLGQFEVLFRLYGPDKAFFDKRWQLPDIETVSDAEETDKYFGLRQARSAGSRVIP